MSYNLGYYLGYFAFGCIVGGLFPLIVALIKKRALLGVAAVIGCGLLSFIGSVASVVFGVVAGIALCMVRKKND